MGDVQFLTLASGLRVAFGEYGARDGTPVFLCHGWPASQVQGARLDAPGREIGVRVISLDRPGVGLSQLQPGRRVIDWPPLLAEVADRLGVGSFRVLGISGGAPYALATAWALPARVEAVAVVCGAPPFAELPSMEGLLPAYRALVALYRVRPAAVRWLLRAARPFALANVPRWLVFLILRGLPAPDAAALRDPEIGAMCLANFRGAWSGSAEGVFADAEMYPQPWGFPIEEVRAPVRLWHGREDRNFSWHLAEAMARRLPRCTARFLDGEGHYSLPMRRGGEILRDLVTADFMEI